MSTFEHITRGEFEAWLDSLGFLGKWKIKPRTQGVYWLALTRNVAIEINSTTGSSDAVMDRAQASMSLRLVSTLNGRVLNKKAMGQSHFARTKNWRKNWAVGVDRMRDAYVKSKEFYDNLAGIEDVEVYQRQYMDLIRSIPNWDDIRFLSDLHTKLSQGGVLTPRQIEAIQNMKAEAVPATPSPVGFKPLEAEHPLLDSLRKLYAQARRDSDQWTMTFAHSLAGQVKQGRTLSPKQRQILTAKFEAHQINVRVARTLRVHALSGMI